MKEESNARALALQIALRGKENLVDATPAEVKRAEEYLAGLATLDGRVALGSTLLILQDVMERARENSSDKLVIDAATRYAELCKLADFSQTDSETRSAQSERETLALSYLESTGVIPTGLELTEAARLIAQYVVDDILAREGKKEETTKEGETLKRARKK